MSETLKKSGVPVLLKSGHTQKGFYCERDIYINLTVDYMIDNQCIKSVYYDLVDGKIKDGEIEINEELDNYLKALNDVDITIENVTFPTPPFKLTD